MTVSTALSKDDPLVIAWEAYRQTEEFDNSKRWAQTFHISNTRDEPTGLRVDHPSLEGSLWAMFMAGWNARGEVPRNEQP